MKTILTVGAIGLAILILSPIVILVAGDMRSQRWVVKLPNDQKLATSKVSISIAQVRAKLDQKLNGGARMSDAVYGAEVKRPELGPRFADATVITNEGGAIDGGFRYTETGTSGDAPISTGPLDMKVQDPGLPAYLKLPVPQRQHDLYFLVLVPSQNNPSIKLTTPDFSKDGETLPYSSSYFLHLEALRPDETEITVLGYNASVTKG